MRMLLLTVAAIGLLTTPARSSVQISSNPTHNMNCSGGICTPTAKNADLNATDLANMLSSQDMTISADSVAHDIEVLAAVSWDSGHKLDLTADRSIIFQSKMHVREGNRLAISTNSSGGSAGDLVFSPRAEIDFAPRASLTINGQNYQLVGALDKLASAIAHRPSGLYALSRDVDAASYGTFPSSPIGKTFTGSFEGLGHTISHVSIDDRFDECVGLFKRIEEGASVRDVLVTNVNMTSRLPHYGRLGAITGCNGGTIANSSVTGILTGVWVGGAVGYNDGIIVNTGSDAIIRGKIAGGLVGISEGTIFQSRAGGPVTGSFVAKRPDFFFDLGGLAGRAGDIRRSYATGSITLVGVRPRESHFSGVGGLVGRLTGNIIDSYATGTIQAGGVTLLGGLVGQGTRGAVRYSYATGALAGSTEGDSATGGVAGSAEAKLKLAQSYWDTDTTGTTAGCGVGSCAGASALTDAQLKSGLPDGFDPQVWEQNPSINNGYPYLIANSPRQ